MFRGFFFTEPQSSTASSPVFFFGAVINSAPLGRSFNSRRWRFVVIINPNRIDRRRMDRSMKSGGSLSLRLIFARESEFTEAKKVNRIKFMSRIFPLDIALLHKETVRLFFQIHLWFKVKSVKHLTWETVLSFPPMKEIFLEMTTTRKQNQVQPRVTEFPRVTELQTWK